MRMKRMKNKRRSRTTVRASKLLKIENLLDLYKHKRVAIKIEEPSGTGKSSKEKAASLPRLGVARGIGGGAHYFVFPNPNLQKMRKVCEHSNLSQL